MGLAGRPTAIVTGGATGVGAATARWLAEHGHNVLVNYHASETEAVETVVQCTEQGADAFHHHSDVAEDADCRGLAAAAIERWGRIDVLINSAGTTFVHPLEDLDALDADDFRHIYSVNAIGPFQMTRAVVPAMRRSGGSIVNISSIAGANGSGSSYAYAASKGALNTLTLALARSLAPDIRVNAILAGMIEGRWLRSRLGDEGFERSRAHYASHSALEAIATPEQIAGAVGWLATAAPLMTGQLVTVDAGATLGRHLALKR